MLVHGSEPNTHQTTGASASPSATSPPHVRQTQGARLGDAGARLPTRIGNFDLEPAPRADLDAAALAAHKDAVERSHKVLYAGTDRTQFRA